MTQRSLNIAFIVAGMMLLLGGLLFHDRALVALPFAGVGGSVLATGLVNLALNYRKEQLPWLQPIERFAHQVDFMRTNHQVEIFLEVRDGTVHVRKHHRFTLVNPYPWSRKREYVLRTDASCSPSGGFYCVREPDDTILEGENLKKLLKLEANEYVFRKDYRIQPGAANRFEFQSRETYRLRDRLVWTVQDFCDDFFVKIHGRKENLKLKINHHLEQAILSRCEYSSAEGATIFHFNSEVFPYQGFELSWNFENWREE